MMKEECDRKSDESNDTVVRGGFHNTIDLPRTVSRIHDSCDPFPPCYEEQQKDADGDQFLQRFLVQSDAQRVSSVFDRNPAVLSQCLSVWCYIGMVG
jgi:hypothetical protein